MEKRYEIYLCDDTGKIPLGYAFKFKEHGELFLMFIRFSSPIRVSVAVMCPDSFVDFVTT